MNARMMSLSIQIFLVVTVRNSKFVTLAIFFGSHPLNAVEAFLENIFGTRLEVFFPKDAVDCQLFRRRFDSHHVASKS
jgi:hypothetical protein